MLYSDDFKDALLAWDRPPQVKVRLQLYHVADAVGKVLVKLARRHERLSRI